MKYLISLSILLLSSFSWSQSDSTYIKVDPALEVRAAIDAMFLGMKNGDSTMVSSVFHTDNRLISCYTNKKGEAKMHKTTSQEFLNAVGTPHKEVWNERISNVVIQVDGNLAQAWMDFSFYVDETFSHCGVNAFQLSKVDGEWLIVSIMDTRREKGCN